MSSTRATYRWEVVDRLARARVIGIVRAATREEADETADALVRAGVKAVEVSLTTPGALRVVERLAATATEATIGAGTVLDGHSAASAVEAGAAFLLSPTDVPEARRTAHRYGRAWIPGVSTASESIRALESGADAIKLFPAAAHGPDGLRALLQTYPQAPFIPTGGIDPASAAEWFAAGAVAVGIGSALTVGDSVTIAARIEQLLVDVAQPTSTAQR